jgi:hypothetical protein
MGLLAVNPTACYCCCASCQWQWLKTYICQRWQEEVTSAGRQTPPETVRIERPLLERATAVLGVILISAAPPAGAAAGAFSALLVFKNPYIYAVLTILTILPQNSNVTSLNNLVLLFYESGLFMNFAEAVTCVRLVTWLSMGFMVASFALFK